MVFCFSSLIVSSALVNQKSTSLVDGGGGGGGLTGGLSPPLFEQFRKKIVRVIAKNLLQITALCFEFILKL
jgi:hypothetical protein